MMREKILNLNITTIFLILTISLLGNFCATQPQEVAPPNSIDLTNATVVIRSGDLQLVEQTAVTVLVEEVEKRTGIKWSISTEYPQTGIGIIVKSVKKSSFDAKFKPSHSLALNFSIGTRKDTISIIGVNPKGALNGVGKFLRTIEMSPGKIILPHPINISSAPDHKIRGHQLGYRNTANSYDAWSPEQYDQYIRELAIFGTNAIENIPLSASDSPHMPITRSEMNRALGNICAKYGMQYWVWTPATVDLSNPKQRSAHLLEHEKFYKDCTKLDAVFFPGGDPGHNHPKDVMPFLAELSVILKKHHPKAKIWMSLQGFEEEGIEYFFNWITKHQPDWFGGAVGGPSSPPLPYMRERLPKKYLLRDYPDITHTVRCQHPVPWIDPAIAFTSGREGSNPAPIQYSSIFLHNQEYIDGFITYSDGMHDDVNKFVYSVLGWNHELNVNSIISEYSRFFFGPKYAEEISDGIFGLEKNWGGSLADNPNVTPTFKLFEYIDQESPELQTNWRWQLLVLKSNYDAYTQERFIFEEGLENTVNSILGTAKSISADNAMDQALTIFKKADEINVAMELRTNIVRLCDDLFNSIGYQTSVKIYDASGYERGAILDYLDYPLNNRWWVEDQFADIRLLETEDEKISRLDIIRKWENPGPGSYYDDIGNVAQSEHVLRGKPFTDDPLMETNPNPDFMWWENQMSRERQSWISKMDWPVGLEYTDLDTSANYILRTTGYGQCLARINGERIYPSLDGKEIGEIKEFQIPKYLYKNGHIKLIFDIPHEPDINWRRQSRLSEVWLVNSVK